MTTATATEIQNNFGRYLQTAIDGNDVIILENGIEVARLVSHKKSISFLTDSLRGVLRNDYDDKAMSAERVKNRESAD